MLSRLDCMNASLLGSPDVLLNKLQALQINPACIVLQKKKCDSVTPRLKCLHFSALSDIDVTSDVHCVAWLNTSIRL